MNIDRYFEWMLDCIGADKSNHRQIETLYLMHCFTFAWTHPLDSNREADGYGLRKEFDSKYHCSQDEWETYMMGPCTVLEMIIALAYRWWFHLHWEPDAPIREQYSLFWEMYNNLGLDKAETDEEVETIIFRMMERDYDEYCHGGMFPISKLPSIFDEDKNRYCFIDMRNQDLWMQMNFYDNEVYPEDLTIS